MARMLERSGCATVLLMVMSCADPGAGDAGGQTSTSSATQTSSSGGTLDTESGDDAPACQAKEPGMVCVEEGPFWMGCNRELDDNCGATEFPYHEVVLDRFDIDVHEVTVAEYRACVEAGACTQADDCNAVRANADLHPINCVDWDQAQGYCAWVGKRLPTEAEWEKAARGTDERTFPWGEDAADCTRTVIDEGGPGCGFGGTHPVGTKLEGASPYGALDMIGNVEEWVNDWFDSGYYGESPEANPLGPDGGTHRIVRGGSFRASDPRIPRVAWRWAVVPTTRYEAGGFRCARSH